MSSQIGQLFERDLWCFFGLPIDNVNLAEANNICQKHVSSREKLFVSTPNVNFLIGSLNDSDFYDSVLASDLVLVDGMPIVWISRLMGIPVRERVAGSDLFESFVGGELASQVFFFGGNEGTAERACASLNERNISTKCSGFLNPGRGSIESMSSNEIIDQINASSPDFVVVSLGAKKGQQWIQRNRKRLNAPLISHLGAVVNFTAGTVERAPACLQTMGGEWLWRVWQEPVLLKRYLSDGLQLANLMVFKLLPLLVYSRYLKFFSQAGNSSITTVIEGDKAVLHLKGHFTVLDRASLGHAVLSCHSKAPSLHIECSGMTYIDPYLVGNIIVLKRLILESGGGFEFTCGNPVISKLIRLNNATAYLEKE